MDNNEQSSDSESGQPQDSGRVPDEQFSVSSPLPLTSSQPSISAPPRSKARLLFNIGIATLLVVVIVVALSPTRDAILNHFIGPTPTSTPNITPGDNLFYIQDTPKGSIFIDERQITHLPVFGKDHPLQLSPGKHQIRWEATPFQPLSCIVSVPSSPTNST